MTKLLLSHFVKGLFINYLMNTEVKCQSNPTLILQTPAQQSLTENRHRESHSLDQQLYRFFLIKLVF